MKRFVAVMVLAWLAASDALTSYAAPSADCRAYVACFESTGGTKGALDGRYGGLGWCYGGSLSVADACDAECRDALTDLRGEFPDAGCLAPRPYVDIAPRGCGR